MVAELMDLLITLINGIFEFFVSGATTLTGVFYDSSLDSFTIWGVLALLGLGITLAFFVLRWISSLIRR